MPFSLGIQVGRCSGVSNMLDFPTWINAARNDSSNPIIAYICQDNTMIHVDIVLHTIDKSARGLCLARKYLEREAWHIGLHSQWDTRR